MSDKGSIWVRYLGGSSMYRAEVFPIPTSGNPDRVKSLLRRGDVAEVWYCASEEWLGQRHAYRLHPPGGDFL